ncbi:replication restart helicase PriA [Halodesulfovibrio marinisediminis]|uniref:Replication restart protein PriA n=1 Tax=Halodesulfovibrio marinisediminis DSM 17456 TaxID=1121457 RepID=A0A1N6DEX0_9BACT|nr:primosomal protein N' [Halodesulfovibrio marinisediminis]SIN69342.1 replication restart DNA helicase PriA [Halodesulfovibrio marinisediminis DSM 17456]
MLAISLLSPPYATLSYATPAWLDISVWKCGQRVIVPLGKGGMLRAGIIVSIDDSSVKDGVVLKECLWPAEREPLLQPEYLAMVKQLALRHVVTEGEVLGGLLPAGLRTTKIRLRVLDGGKPRTMAMRDVANMSDIERCSLGVLWASNAVEVLDSTFDAEEQELCSLLEDPPWSVRPSAKRQIEVLDFLYDKGMLSRKRLLQELGSGVSAALNTLAERGLIRIGPREEGTCEACQDDDPECFFEADEGFVLYPEQQTVFDEFSALMHADGARSALLYGITGSGKTVVYLELAAEALANGRSVMLLAPEVALACKLEHAVHSRFPSQDCFFYNGYQSPTEREKTFRTLAERTAPCIIVGTRSALFLPSPTLGLIVLDEEHDTSFKQDEGLVYQAKEVAYYRAQQSNGLLLLGSATPDVKTFHAVQQKAVSMGVMRERAGEGELPEVSLLNIKNMKRADGILAAETKRQIRETVERGEQVVILLNRRGYSPLMYCLDCGQVARCPHCEVGLTYHKERERLICHYCGYSVTYPVVCSKCKGLHYLPMGEGTEKLEEYLAEILPPDTKILRLDRDSTRRPGKMQRILDAFANQEAQVLVGTQMLSKGHHFPNVTLAVVADGDLGLNLPDYRAAERTFQLLVQASGRAGRGEKAGRVLIQTRDPEHYCWQFVGSADYDGFYAEEIERRRKRKYPPFVKLALVRVSYPLDWRKGMEWVESLTEIARALGKEHNVRVLGHTPSPLPVLRGRKRFQWTLKSDGWVSIRTLYYAMRKAVPRGSKLRLSLDIDPVNML